jgi:hypothetical protein
MPIFEKLQKATEERNGEGCIGLMADGCVFVRHRTGQEMNRDEIAAMLRKMMAPGGAVMGQRRCIHENDDILVVYSIDDCPDGSREAVFADYSLKDGKITRLETGATPLA